MDRVAAAAFRTGTRKSPAHMTTPASTLPAPPTTARRRTTVLQVSDTPDVVVRVLATLRRRNCVILGVDYRAGDRHRPGELSVDYSPPPRCGHTVSQWLANLVDVVAVDGVNARSSRDPA